ncbi:HWE histidine kinase domain-containing protein [Chelativorans sp.]|uniref:HWE histidine kinase domain-containing protein n=1 Tax=Chelativorans sp. TaxID=2203393 RepID=UPI0028121349|nr:HWE histidine kinase domain-containing protein [Chelativorans sp.]
MDENLNKNGREQSRGALLDGIPTGSLLEALPVGLYVCAPDGTILHHNRRAEEIWGRSPAIGDAADRFCGSYRLYWPDGRYMPPEECPMAAALRSREPYRNISVMVERPDGSRVATLVNIDPVFDEAGEFRGAVNCFQSVTEAERAHAHAKQKERELEATLSALPAAVYRTDAAGKVTFYNEAAVVLAGRRPEIGVDQWCISWRIYTTEGAFLPHDQCPMAVALREQRPISGAEIVVEHPDGARFPCLVFPTPLFDDHGVLTGAVNMLIDISDRKRAENNQRLLINELNHRVKNTLAMVQAIASQTLRRSRSPAEFVASLSGRIQAFARAHNFLLQGTSGVDLMDLVTDQVLLDTGGVGRISCSGPPVHLEASSALHLALVLYELGTNARKYGSLSVPEGRVVIDWNVRRNGEQVLNLNWREEGGPPVSAPSSVGFGTALIERSMRTYGAEVTTSYNESGLECSIHMPLPQGHPSLVDRIAGQGLTPGADVDYLFSQGRPLDGKRVLLVEDEPLVALDLESSLREKGCIVVGPAGTVSEALRLIGGEAIDAALVDANLQGEPAGDVAAALTRAGIRFAFVSGYGREGLPASFQQAPLVAKPFRTEEVISCLEDLVRQPDTASLIRRAGAE